MRAALLPLILLPLALAAGEPVFRDLRVGPDGIRGEAALPDRTEVALTLRAVRPGPEGPRERLVESLQASVRGGAFEVRFETERPLAHGAYRLEASVDRGRQLPYLKLPDGELRGEAAFEIDFREDVAGPASALAAAWAALRALEAERTRALDLPLEGDAGYAAFLPGWQSRVRLESARTAVYEEDLLYPEARRLLGALASRMLVAGHERAREDLGADFAKAADALASEFAFHAACKAREALARARTLNGAGKQAAWDRYREAFAADLERMRAGLQGLSTGPMKEAFSRRAAGVAALLDAAGRLAESGDAAPLERLLP